MTIATGPAGRIQPFPRVSRRAPGARHGRGPLHQREGGSVRPGWALLTVMLACTTSASMGTPAKDRHMPQQQMTTPIAPRGSIDGELAALGRATTWINSAPLTPAALKGKVVLVQFWTYSCINWLRNEPYVRAWAEKYEDGGLVVVGVHSPEFGFEHSLDNVRRAARDFQVDYPIAIDNDFTIWRGFNNQYWPALYFIDSKGRVRHHQFGEGSYPQSEKVIQQLLAETGARIDGDGLVSVEGRGVEAAADWSNLNSPENYLGYARTENFTSPGGLRKDQRHGYATPTRLRLNQWALYGDWTVGKQATVSHRVNGRIVYRFHARDLHLVMGAAVQGTPVRFRVLIDGQPPGSSHGLDVDALGNGTVGEPRLYQLLRQSGPIDDRQFEIEFLDSGVEVFAFTFG
jgi:thiol-disulfide isomerase/thioredoxin